MYKDVRNRKKSTLKSRKIKKLGLKEVFGKMNVNNSDEKVTEVKGIWEYFCHNTSFHGIKYCSDKQLFRIENITWFIAVIFGFAASIDIICVLYGNYQTTKSEVVVDDLQANLTRVPFPSVTICPITKTSLKDINESVEKLIPNKSNKAKSILKEVLYKLSDVYIAEPDLVKFNHTHLESDEFNEVNLTEAALMVTPKCEDVLFDCTWNYDKVNCCEIFDLQKTYYGFCYAFNSQCSISNSISEPRKSIFADSKGGLTVTMKSDMFENEKADVMIEDPYSRPSKNSLVSFGHHYEIPLRFLTTYSEPAVLALESISNPPCRYENGTYRSTNCRINRLKKYYQRRCNCTPILFFDQYPGEPQECHIRDIKCIKDAVLNVQDLTENFAINMDAYDSCAVNCEYHRYEYFTLDQPLRNDSLSMDIHFDSRTGMRYKRKIVISSLDMMVQFGGIFGLFVGGSVLTFTELLYAFFKSIYFCVYHFLKKKCQKKKPKINQSISIIPFTH